MPCHTRFASGPVADESRAASSANPVGRILRDIEPLKTISDGTTVVVEADP